MTSYEKVVDTWKVSLLCCLATVVLSMSWFTTSRAQNPVCTRTYTVDADFAEGNLLNVNYDAPNSDQLQLNAVTAPFPYVNIACSGRGTVVRIHVVTGAILGEYWTAPSGMAKNPSRTTVDQYGNVWVTNRDENSLSGGSPKGSITRIAIVIGGTRCDADKTPNPAGQYLKPPFQYNTAIDRDEDGLIKTSFGLGNILPWPNPGGVNTDGGVTEAEDECIINFVRTAGTNARTVVIDANNDVWVGGLGNHVHERIDGVTGLPDPLSQFDNDCGGYGGVMDANGILWSSGGSTNKPLLRLDPATLPPTGTCLTGVGDYGLAIDPNTGHIWHTYLSGNLVRELDGNGNVLNSYSHGENYAQGIAIDGNHNVWIAHSLVPPSSTVGHIRTDGTFIGNVTVGTGPTGVAVDANGKIWVANYNSNSASRIDPDAGPIVSGYHVGAVDLTVDLGSGAAPYNYSDMTGFVAIGSTSPSGTWTVIHDGLVDGTKWGKVSWTRESPTVPGTNIKVEIRAADLTTSLPSVPFVEVQNDLSICGTAAEVAGRYVEIRTTLSRTAPGTTPILSDLSLFCCNRPPVALCQDVTVYTTANCMASVTPSQIDNGSYDPDGDALTLSLDDSGPWPAGTYPVTLTAEDIHGASSTCNATVTVVEILPNPTITVTPSPTVDPGGDPLTIYIGYGPQTVNLAVSEGVAWTWTSDPAGFTSTLQNPNVSPTVTTKYMVEVTNDVGCKKSVDVTIQVVDIRCGNKMDKVTIAHFSSNHCNTLCIAPSAVPAHLANHGDHLGPCPPPKAGQNIIGLPDEITLQQNYPNPFDGTTVIAYSLPTSAPVTIRVFDLLGREVAKLVSGDQQAGFYNVQFDARHLPFGTYVYKLESSNIVITRVMTLMH